MKRTYSQIDLDERRKIERWRQAGVGVDMIAEKLGRHRSTIRCVRRGFISTQGTERSDGPSRAAPLGYSPT